MRMKQPTVEVVFQKNGKSFLEQLKEIIRIKTGTKTRCAQGTKH